MRLEGVLKTGKQGRERGAEPEEANVVGQSLGRVDLLVLVEETDALQETSARRQTLLYMNG